MKIISEVKLNTDFSNVCELQQSYLNHLNFCKVNIGDCDRNSPVIKSFNDWTVSVTVAYIDFAKVFDIVSLGLGLRLGLALRLWLGLSLSFNPRRAMIMSYTLANDQGQRSVDWKDRVETDGRTDRRTEAIALLSALKRSVKIGVL